MVLGGRLRRHRAFFMGSWMDGRLLKVVRLRATRRKTATQKTNKRMALGGTPRYGRLSVVQAVIREL